MWLSNQLKLRGPILEVNYGDSLDKIFFMFRNVLQFDNLNYNIRLPLLQLVELRANRWKCTDGVNSYYRPKVSKIQEVRCIISSHNPFYSFCQSSHIFTNEFQKPGVCNSFYYLMNAIIRYTLCFTLFS